MHSSPAICQVSVTSMSTRLSHRLQEVGPLHKQHAHTPAARNTASRCSGPLRRSGPCSCSGPSDGSASMRCNVLEESLLAPWGVFVRENFNAYSTCSPGWSTFAVGGFHACGFGCAKTSCACHFGHLIHKYPHVFSMTLPMQLIRTYSTKTSVP